MIENLSPQIESILAAGNQAPSGENCQPWRFVVNGLRVEIHSIPERDISYYNAGSRSSYIAIGAVIENTVIAATSVGFGCSVLLFPSDISTHIATLDFIPDPAIHKDPLEPEIFLRATNRKKFLIMRLSDSEKRSLIDAAVHSTSVTVHFAEERNEIKELAQVGAANEEIMLSNKDLHEFFFSHVNWSKQEDNERKVGFFLKTLELPGPAAAIFAIVRYWQVMEKLLGLNFHKFIARQNASTYEASAAIGALSIDSDEPKDYIEAGRAMERIWLTATQLGFSIQPLTGILFLKLKADLGEGRVFSSEHQVRIQQEYDRAQKIFNCSGRRIAFMFRIGSGAPPSARSARFPLTDIVKIS